MTDVACTNIKQVWYKWERLPLIPVIRTRKEDDQNTWSFCFHWLIFVAWTSDAPMLGASIDFAENGCFNLRLNLPYLWTGIFIPYYPAWRNYFWRKPKSQRIRIKAEKETKRILARMNK